MAHDAMMSTGTSITHVEEVLELYSELMKLDPPHYQYYKNEHSLVLLKQVIFSSHIISSLVLFIHVWTLL